MLVSGITRQNGKYQKKAMLLSSTLIAGADWLFKTTLANYRQTGPLSSGVTRNSRRLQIIIQ